MNRMQQDMAESTVPEGGVRLYWVGQAGFAFLTSAGKRIYLDPYLSDACEHMHGFVRLALPAISANEVEADWVVSTHEHADHLDPEAIPVIARNNPECRFAGTPSCKEGWDAAGIEGERRVVMTANETYDLGDLVIDTARADHGAHTPDALAMVLDFGGVKVMVTGDTSFRADLLKPLMALNPDVLLPVINGVFGNMGHLDAVQLVQEVKPRLAIPCHFWTFAEHGAGDPMGFLNACARHCPEVEAKLVRPGAGILVEARS